MKHGWTDTITDLKTLIEILSDIYKYEGNLKTVIMRRGEQFPEIELNVDNFDNGTLYIEAYEAGEV